MRKILRNFVIIVALMAIISVVVLSGCVKNDAPLDGETPSGIVDSGNLSSGEVIDSGEETPSGEIVSGDSGSGEITSGEEINSGDETPSGDIGSGEEQKPQLPTDIADFSDEQKTALFNAIEEHKATILKRCGVPYASVSNTKTIGYDIDLSNQSINALYKMTRNNEDTYFVVKIEIKTISQNNNSISVEISSYSLQNRIYFQNVENKFSPNAENVYLYFNKVILPDNARYSAYSISTIPGFGAGHWPIVTTNAMYTLRGTIYFNSFDILTDGYGKFTKSSDGGARYEERGGFSFQFGDDKTLWADDFNG